MAEYPEVHVEFASDAGIVDIVAPGFDAGVRFGDHLQQDMIAVPLGPPLRYAIVAAPEYLARHGRPETPADLVGHACIRRRYSGGHAGGLAFREGGQGGRDHAAGRLTLNSAPQVLQATLAGQGIAHVIDDYARTALAEGRLVEVLADWSPRLPSWYLYYPNRRHSSAAMQAFLAFVRRANRLGDWPPEEGAGAAEASQTAG
jgi:DNA-binding transcriptional LysR family regulator